MGDQQIHVSFPPHLSLSLSLSSPPPPSLPLSSKQNKTNQNEYISKQTHMHMHVHGNGNGDGIRGGRSGRFNSSREKNQVFIIGERRIVFLIFFFDIRFQKRRQIQKKKKKKGADVEKPTHAESWKWKICKANERERSTES